MSEDELNEDEVLNPHIREELKQARADRKARAELARAKGTLLEERNIRIEDHTPGSPAGGSR